MRRTASEMIRNLESRIARLEKSAVSYNPNDMFEVEKGKGFIRFYVGGQYNHNKIFDEINATFYRAFEKEFISENEFPYNRTVESLIEEAYDRSNLVEELSRTRKGEKAIQVNLFNIDMFIKNVVGLFEKYERKLDNDGVEYILDWSEEYEALKATEVAVKALMDKYGEVRVDKIDPRTYRLASTRKVAGHIILAGNVNVRQIRRVLEDMTPRDDNSISSIEDIEFEDGVLTFLMATMDDPSVEKKVKALAKKHDVKFEKGEFTDGLGMIYTKNASRRNRRMR